MANRYLPEDPSSWGPSEKEIEEFPYNDRGRKPPALADWQAFAAPWQKRAEARGFADPFAMIGRDIAAAEHDQRMRETEARMQAEIEREIGVPASAPRAGTQHPPAFDNPSARPDDAMTRQAARPEAQAGARIGFTRPPPQKTLLAQPARRTSTRLPEDGEPQLQAEAQPTRDARAQRDRRQPVGPQTQIRSDSDAISPGGAPDRLFGGEDKDAKSDATGEASPERNEHGLVDREIAWEDRDDDELDDKGFDVEIVDLIRSAKAATPQTLQQVEERILDWNRRERANREGNEVLAYAHEMDQTVQALRQLARRSARGEDGNSYLKYLRQAADGWSRLKLLEGQEIVGGVVAAMAGGLAGAARLLRSREQVARMRALQDPSDATILRQALFKGNGPDEISDDLLRHIFLGERSRSGRSTGLHHEGAFGDRPPFLILQRSKPDRHGVYRASVAVFDPRTGTLAPKNNKSTMFPRDMSPDDVVRLIAQAEKAVPRVGNQEFIVPDGPKKGMALKK